MRLPGRHEVLKPGVFVCSCLRISCYVSAPGLHPVCNPPEGPAYVPRARSSARCETGDTTSLARESDSATGTVQDVGADVGVPEEAVSEDRVVGRWGEDTS